jgi:transglutaminase-like putative cysteine protease
VPARYVVGYCADAPGAGAAAEHAWTEVLIPGAGWRGFDLGRQALVDAGYVAVAVGREHADAQSQRATWKGAPAAPSASVSVQMQQQAQ